MSQGGKGSGRRPTQVPAEVFSTNWDTIFKKKVEDNCEECTNCQCGKKVNTDNQISGGVSSQS